MLEKYSGFPRTSTDIIRSSILHEDKFSPEMVKSVFEIALHKIEIALAESKHLIIEGLFISDQRREKLIKLIPNNKRVFIYIEATEDILIKRLLMRYENKLNSEKNGVETLTKETLQTFYLKSKKAKPLNTIEVDTSVLKPEESFKYIITKISML